MSVPGDGRYDPAVYLNWQDVALDSWSNPTVVRI